MTTMPGLMRFISGMVGWLPIVAVLVIAIVLAVRTWNEHPQRARLTVAGAGVILAGDVIRLIWAYAIVPVIWDLDGVGRFSDLMFAGATLGFAVLDAVGMGLLVWAIFARRPEPNTSHIFS